MMIANTGKIIILGITLLKVCFFQPIFNSERMFSDFPNSKSKINFSFFDVVKRYLFGLGH